MLPKWVNILLTILAVIAGLVSITQLIEYISTSKSVFLGPALTITIILVLLSVITARLSNKTSDDEAHSNNPTESKRSPIVSIIVILMLLGLGVYLYLFVPLDPIDGPVTAPTEEPTDYTETPIIAFTPTPAIDQEEDILYPNIEMNKISKYDVTSSGYLEAENYGVSSSYYPFYVIDGDLHTAWLDNDANGFGYNEWVQIKFDQTYIVNGIQIYSGYHKNEEILHRNNRIKDIEIVFSDGSSLMQTLEDKPVGEYNIIELDESIATKSVKFIIKSVYPADYPYAVCWDDTGISEIILY